MLNCHFLLKKMKNHFDMTPKLIQLIILPSFHEDIKYKKFQNDIKRTILKYAYKRRSA